MKAPLYAGVFAQTCTNDLPIDTQVQSQRHTGHGVDDVVPAGDLQLYRTEGSAFKQALETRAGGVEGDILRGNIIIGTEPVGAHRARALRQKAA